MKAFIDTSAFCALAVPKDQNNPRANFALQRLQKRKPTLYTSDYVLDETYTLLKMRSSHRTSIKFMDEIGKSGITIVRVSEDLETAAKAIFKKFDDRKLSFTDCTSFALINHWNIEAVFAFDNHFRYHPYTHPVELLD